MRIQRFLTSEYQSSLVLQQARVIYYRANCVAISEMEQQVYVIKREHVC